MQVLEELTNIFLFQTQQTTETKEMHENLYGNKAPFLTHIFERFKSWT
jgi:hypothetical protein